MCKRGGCTFVCHVSCCMSSGESGRTVFGVIYLQQRRLGRLSGVFITSKRRKSSHLQGLRNRHFHLFFLLAPHVPLEDTREFSSCFASAGGWRELKVVEMASNLRERTPLVRRATWRHLCRIGYVIMLYVSHPGLHICTMSLSWLSFLGEESLRTG